MGVRGNSALRGVNEATTTANTRRRLTCGGFAPERVPLPQGVRRPPAREARRCGHESRELQTAILSHDNDNGRERQTDN